MLYRVTRDSTDTRMHRPGQSRPLGSQASRAGTGKQWSWQSTSDGQGEGEPSHTYTANLKAFSLETKAACGQERHMRTFKAHKNTLERLGVEHGTVTRPPQSPLHPWKMPPKNMAPESCISTQMTHWGPPKNLICLTCRNMSKCLWAKRQNECPFFLIDSCQFQKEARGVFSDVYPAQPCNSPSAQNASASTAKLISTGIYQLSLK